MSRASVGTRRRIAVVTGTRAEYGLLKSTMQALRRRRNVKLQLVVTGMHLLKRFGHTIDEIRSDGWSIDATIKMQRGDDAPTDHAEGLGRGVEGIAKFLIRAKTDIVVVLGDRIEALAGALAGSTTGRIVAHIHGGDVAPGCFDDAHRHCITKLAHVHFAATTNAARRIVRLGERPESVHVTGAPGLDQLVRLVGVRTPAANGRTDALIVQHPQGRSAAQERRVMNSILRAVASQGLRPTIVYPNTDPGHSGIVDAIRRFKSKARPADVMVHASVPRDDYLRTLIGSRVLVGNSSSGIIEAATAGTAVVNVGERQKGRLRAGPAIIDSDESFEAITRALAQALTRRPKPAVRTSYGDGRAGEAIARILGELGLSDTVRRKQITY